VENVSLENTQSQPTSLPAVSAPAPSVAHEVLARTGAETDALLTLAGLALLLGGLALTFGESQAAVERRR
jgi:LPXTG-motif cell wall-anchored protein